MSGIAKNWWYFLSIVLFLLMVGCKSQQQGQGTQVGPQKGKTGPAEVVIPSDLPKDVGDTLQQEMPRPLRPDSLIN